MKRRAKGARPPGHSLAPLAEGNGAAETAIRPITREPGDSMFVEERRGFEALQRIGAFLGTDRGEPWLVQQVLDETTALVRASVGAFCFETRMAGEPVSAYATSGTSLEEFLPDFPLPRASPPFDPFHRDGLLRCEDVRTAPQFSSYADGPHSIVSYLAVPIVTPSGEIRACLFFAHGEVGRFTREHERLVASIAAQMGIALESFRLRARLRESEATARNASAAARDAERRKDEFLALLGHELRNPLAPIVTALELLRLRGAMGRETQIIQRQVDHLARLVDDLLDVARITRGKFELKREHTEMSHVVARAVQLASVLIERRAHHLEVDVPEGLAVFGDPARLAQIVANLLTNAAKYTERGGHIRVRGWAKGETVALSVTDDGAGISASALPTIFEPFVQGPQASDRAQGGLGLGLALVRNLTLMHGGRVEVTSGGEHQGSEFVVHFPFEREPRSSEAPQGEVRAAVDSAPLRVLLVDDNADAAAVLSEALSELGHDVATAMDGPTALRLAEAFQPDVAVLDIGLPVMDGCEARGSASPPPAPRSAAISIALTGYGQS